MPEPRVRIFSDLHYRDPASLVQNLDAFAPLLEGTEQVVFNGDTFDTQIPNLRAHVGEGRAFFARTAPGAIFLSGNHDPDVSDQAELGLRGGRVWITHGDVFFDDIAPWSHHRLELRRRIATLGADLPPGALGRIETRLRLHRLACQKLPDPPGRFRPTLWSRLRRLTRTLFPPTHVFLMLRAWRETPRLAAALARAQRPLARVVILGHTHYPGVWQVRGTPRVTVINTGSFTPPFGSLFVDIEGDHVRVVRIAQSGRRFLPGPVVAGFALDA